MAEMSAVALETRDAGIPACAGMTEDLEAPFDRLRVSGSEERDRLRLAEAVAGALTTVLNVTPSVAETGPLVDVGFTPAAPPQPATNNIKIKSRIIMRTPRFKRRSH